ncbi:Phosphatidylethanolamine N-methyltransferase [Purpureocillium takamizusanense]|uniref:Phosphatidylethanolamine N-methyltransferase n=1 Tax=Purpureocillium takamizusanense TaxID=2060973 RepID=A0A9Q8QM04_9HYPO|nr:Phosphatidylethanolamine N-methyltransferase [Purpureocillium takamizusanense]UNI21611.1 Phosphatidylethanolamine N-methyltransferase [Purpureocillium takamizusanense]
MTTAAAELPSDGGELRLRQARKATNAASVSTPELVASKGNLVRDDEHADKVKGKKTFGRTPDGTVFIVPTTHDMVSQLLDPRQPKNLSDVLVLGILALHILAAYMLPAGWKRPVFALIFLCWRAAYNVGIGVLLHIQSHHRRLITWARRWKLFEDPKTGRNPRPWLYRLLKRELEAKIPEDYQFDKAPLEYNTWLVFRRVVDLILMCDFVSYCLFAIVCGHTPKGEGILMGLARWALGIALVGFNLWVKLDAHRVVKDFAWYWGDFFYLIDQDLTFDGVFEMAPHPMYSIGYAGYYGISMMAASYEVLFISIVAHLAQFAFLVTVENPHIEKTYNPPPPRPRTLTMSQSDVSLPLNHHDEASVDRPDSSASASAPAYVINDPPAAVHDMVGLNNMDLFRVPDCVVVILPLYVAVLTLVTPSTPIWQALFVAHALGWRVWYHLGLGLILDRQSKTKMWTRHFLKFGESAGEAWRQWKGMHHISMIMCNTAFIAACWKMYSPPADWGYGLVLLKHVMGASLVALQLWTAFSVYDSLGEFGWFCGDFFFDQEAKLTYTSIYRFLNNPERIFGTAGVWGGALITWSRSIFIMAIVTQILSVFYLSFIERPHMQKVYGRSLRREAGLTKFIKRSLPPPVKGWQESVDKVLDDTAHFVEDFLDTARPKFAAGVKTIVRDTSALFNMAPARLTLTRIAPDLAGLDPKQYSLSVDGTVSMLASTRDVRASGKESVTGRFPKEIKTRIYEYGSPLKVRWRAPANHSPKDWIGLYMVTDNRSRETTEVSSLGRWAPTNAGVYDALTADSSIVTAEHAVSVKGMAGSKLVEGEVLFQGDKLWWTQGVFEFRYHHDGNHSVMTVSEPFEIRIGPFAEEDVDVDAKGLYAKAVESAILPVVKNCLDRDPDIAPSTVDEPFGSHVERDGKYARRIVYAIREMFGIEFAPAVVLADRNVRKLAWRICNAKEVLAPYSMSHSKGTTTPAALDFEAQKA